MKIQRNKIFATAYEHFVKEQDLKSLQKKLVKETLTNNFSNELINFSFSLLKSINKKFNNRNYYIPKTIQGLGLDSILFLLFEREHIFDKTNVYITKLSNKKYTDKKLEYIDNFIKSNKEDIKNNKIINKINDNNGNYHLDTLINKLKNSINIFYLCSEHSDCAKDHIKYQGKLYIDKDWENSLRYLSIFADNDVSKNIIDNLIIEVNRYLEKRNIQTIQWVLGKPVYMTTRPNCRHFFIPLSCGEVLSTYSINKLIDKHHLHFSKGGDTNDDNFVAQLAYNQYNDRLKFHEELKKVYENEQLNNAIRQDKRLINKWRQQLK